MLYAVQIVPASDSKLLILGCIKKNLTSYDQEKLHTFDSSLGGKKQKMFFLRALRVSVLFSLILHAYCQTLKPRFHSMVRLDSTKLAFDTRFFSPLHLPPQCRRDS